MTVLEELAEVREAEIGRLRAEVGYDEEEGNYDITEYVEALENALVGKAMALRMLRREGKA